MEIKRYEKNGFQVLRITEDLGIRSKPAPIRDAVAGYLDKGIKNIAVSFTPHSFLSSETVAVCIQCVEMAQDKGARLAIIRPNEQIREILRMTDLIELVEIYSSEEELKAT